MPLILTLLWLPPSVQMAVAPWSLARRLSLFSSSLRFIIIIYAYLLNKSSVVYLNELSWWRRGVATAWNFSLWLKHDRILGRKVLSCVVPKLFLIQTGKPIMIMLACEIFGDTGCGDM